MNKDINGTWVSKVPDNFNKEYYTFSVLINNNWSDEVPDPQNLDMWLDLNGKRMQSGNTRTMIFGVRKLISYCSHYMTLLPGDVICTGTPPGVGLGVKPNPLFLKVGDVVTLGIQGLGQQSQKIVAPPLPL